MENMKSGDLGGGCKLGMRLNVHVHMYVSLVPRPSHRPVFDRLQYAKTEGKVCSIFIT